MVRKMRRERGDFTRSRHAKQATIARKKARAAKRGK